jgi:hypothetical protein
MNREKGGGRVREEGALTRVGSAGGAEGGEGPVGGGCQGWGRGERREKSVGIRRRLAEDIVLQAVDHGLTQPIWTGRREVTESGKREHKGKGKKCLLPLPYGYRDCGVRWGVYEEDFF